MLRLALLLGYLFIATLLAQPACTRSPEPEPGKGTAPSSAKGEQSHRFDGLRIDVLTFQGPMIVEPLRRRAAEMHERTGLRVEIHTVAFNELYEAVGKGFQEGRYHGAVLSTQWLVDYAAAGQIEELGSRIAGDPDLRWNDIALFFREFSSSYDGRVYAIPFDGDFQMVYYRADLLAQAGMRPPVTWDDYIAIAKRFHGTDINGDNNPDFGSCIAKKPQSLSYWNIWSIAGSFLQTNGTRQGAFFDPDTMKPLVNNRGFAAALAIYEETGRYAPDNELMLTLTDARELFIAGRCALTIDWGDIGTLAIAPHSRVARSVGAAILPGTRRVLDHATGTLVPCTESRCPHAIAGINHAPYAAFGGWGGVISASAPAPLKDAVFAFFFYVSQPAQANVDVTIGASGFNPYRISQLQTRAAWHEAGMSDEVIGRYLGAIGASLNSPNMVLDLRIPQTQRYQQVVLDNAITRFLTRELTAAETMAEIESGWEAITEELGRNSQRQAYRASLGMTK